MREKGITLSEIPEVTGANRRFEGHQNQQKHKILHRAEKSFPISQPKYFPSRRY